MDYRNPVIPGFHPDPSVCRVGEDFYLVTSSFEFFPGVPIHHSRNLVDWELVGHALPTEEHLPLKGARASEGIWAPTLRHHGGLFYLSTTNFGNGHNFFVTAPSIKGPWSRPTWVPAKGIDPTIFFDDDGEAWYLTNRNARGEGGICIAPLDLATGRLKAEPCLLTKGSGGRALEAPHLYRRGEFYHLIAAEGGTEEGHMVTHFRSQALLGPYEPCPRNPILSHRDRHFDEVQATGHADLFEDGKGNWWAVLLAIRTIDRLHLHNLGRETFLAPVRWVDDWPVIGNAGTVALEMEGPLPAPLEGRSRAFSDDFSTPTLRPEWNFVRNPPARTARIEDGALHLGPGGAALSHPTLSPRFVGIRQTGFEETFEADVETTEGTSAGLTAYLTDEHHYDVFVRKAPGGTIIGLRKRIYDLETVTAEIPWSSEGAVRLRIVAGKRIYSFFVLPSGGDPVLLGTGKTAGLCTEVTSRMTFTGVYFGLWAEGGTARFGNVTKTETVLTASS